MTEATPTDCEYYADCMRYRVRFSDGTERYVNADVVQRYRHRDDGARATTAVLFAWKAEPQAFEVIA